MIFLRSCSLLILLAVASIGCEVNTESNHGRDFLKTDPEEYFLLDSTNIGISTIASGLSVPWEITWGPDGWIWYTEIAGRISKVNPANGEKKVLMELENVYTRTTPGLLGMDIHPEPTQFPYLFLTYTEQKEDETIVLNIMRYTITGDQLTDPKRLLEVPGGRGHNGTRIKIGTDGKLYVSTGEASKAETSQNVSEWGGKVLRMNIDGTIPSDNPFPDNPVWAWGLRNPQGLIQTADGRIFVSDHGDATDDEVNLIKKRGNYGWPEVWGFCDTEDEKAYCADSVIVEPIKAWTPTIAPAGIDHYSSEAIPEWKNALLLTALKGSSLRVLHLSPDGMAIESESVLFDGKFGRLRDVCISPAGDIYIATSNQDWNPTGTPQANDDRIIRLFNLREMDVPDSVLEYKYKRDIENDGEMVELSGERIYQDYCSSCHKADGEGVPGIFPPLTGTTTVLNDDKQNLIASVLEGVSGIIEVNGVEYNEHMPSFSFLTDKEVAKTLTYIRSNFGNDAGEILAEEVKGIRDRLD